MDLAACMDQLGDQLDTIDGLRVYRYPPDSIQPPCAVVDLPESITLDLTYSRGADSMTIPVTVLVGKVSDRASRDQIAPYFAGAGDRSIKQVVEAGTYTAFDGPSMRVRAADDPFEVWTYAGIAYLGGAFLVDITGEGA